MSKTIPIMMIGELRKILTRLYYPRVVMQERAILVDHSTVHRWALKTLPVMAIIFRRRKRPVGASWRIDGARIKVVGQWRYLYRAVDKRGDTVDFLLPAKRDLAAARCYLERATNLHDLPGKITIDKSGANTAAIRSGNADACPDVELRQSKYLNYIVEQDYRAVKRIAAQMLGLKSIRAAQKLIAGIETMQMVKTGQLDCPNGQAISAADWFYRLAI
jgi:transposase-like protein